MDSADESFTIISKETLLENDQLPPPKHTKIHKKKTIVFALLILAILISSTMIYSSMSGKKRSKPSSAYLYGSAWFFCHLTMYRTLCYDSMSSIISSKDLITMGPGQVFSASFRVSINELNNVSISITKALSSTTNGSLVELQLSKCQAWVHNSLSRLNESLSMLGGDSDVESLTYMEMDNMKAWIMDATTSASECRSGLEELVDTMVKGTLEEKMGVEEVKLGVEKARKYMVINIGLLNARDSILFDYYTPDDESTGTYYYDYFYYRFDYRFMVCLYAVLYLFLGLLYFLFWRGD